MVNIFGNSITSAFTNGTPVTEIYTYGDMVWPPEPIPTSYYYSWLPTSARGSITSDESHYVNVSAYHGYFDLGNNSMPEYRFITDSNTYYQGIKFFSTNVTSVPGALLYADIYLQSAVLDRCRYIGVNAFNKCSQLSIVDIQKCKYIGAGAFEECTSLRSISLPKCEYIGEEAFNSCRLSSSLYLPRCSYIGSYAFCQCELKSISIPACSYIGSCAFMSCSFSTFSYNLSYIEEGVFANCYNLKNVNLSICKKIYGYAFRNCSSLASLNAPVCTHIYSSAFQDCLSLGNIDLPECTYIGSNVFADCGLLKTISLPKCETIGRSAFSGCYNISKISLPKCKTIGFGAFTGCTNLSKITLNASSMCKLPGTTLSTGSYTFSGTKITSTTGSICVPQSLVMTYKADTNWLYFKNRIFSIT